MLLAATSVGHGAAGPLVRGDASIRHDVQVGTWTLGAGGAALTLALDPSRDFEILSLVSPTSHVWTVGAVPGTSMTVNGTTLKFGSRAAGFRYESVSTSDDGHVLRLDAIFALPAAGLRVVRHFAVADGSPTFETWSTLERLTTPVSVSNLNATAIGSDIMADGIDILQLPGSAAHILMLTETE